MYISSPVILEIFNLVYCKFICAALKYFLILRKENSLDYVDMLAIASILVSGWRMRQD